MGRVEGNDISVESGTAADSAPAPAAHGAPSFVFNGSVVTVHAGKARLTLVAGGQVDICGPAKIHAAAVRRRDHPGAELRAVHVQLPASTPLRIFTPTIIATPLDISGASRDITAGLNLNDSLCVRATSGAIRLEHQFTGERLIVPQTGDFFLSAGNLVPVAGTPGSCECTPMHAQSLPPPQIPLMGVTSRRPAECGTVSFGSGASPPPAPQTASDCGARRSLRRNRMCSCGFWRASERDASDLAGAERLGSASAGRFRAGVQDYLPPLVYSARQSPAPPEDPAIEAVMLVRTVHVEPD